MCVYLAGDLTEYIEIFDIDLSPSYRIGHDIRDCYFGKELDLSVFEADTTVTLEITISEKHIIIYINGENVILCVSLLQTFEDSETQGNVFKCFVCRISVEFCELHPPRTV